MNTSKKTIARLKKQLSTRTAQITKLTQIKGGGIWYDLGNVNHFTGFSFR